MKLRIDKLLLERGFAPSRERAQAMVLAGKVMVNGQKVEKSGTQVADDCELRILGADQPYVSRGGVKLAHALAHWKIALSGRICADVGASTGGFTDCMLQHGAACVFAVDTGYGQIAGKLRQDQRVFLLENTNARHLAPDAFGAAIEFLAMDVSFISATLVLPAVVRAAFGPEDRRRGEIIVLVKPQFEAGREHIAKGGIVKDAAVRAATVEKVKAAIAGLGGKEIEVIDSPITGSEGNIEFLLHAGWGS